MPVPGRACRSSGSSGSLNLRHRVTHRRRFSREFLGVPEAEAGKNTRVSHSAKKPAALVLALPLALGLLVSLGAATLPGCASGPRTRPEPTPAVRRALDRAPAAAAAAELNSPDAAVRLDAVRALGRLGRGAPADADAAAEAAAGLLGDADPAVREAAFFAVGATGSAKAAALLSAGIDTAPTGCAAAAAQGLAACKDDAAQALLVRIALRDDRPVEALEALFCQVRWGGKALGTTLPDARLLGWATHPSARGRAALGHLGRACKDPALLPVLVSLLADADFEVRRAAALGLANGRAKTARDAAGVDAALSALVPVLRDPDARVAAAACRAVASYDSPVAVRHLLELLGSTNGIAPVSAHPDFNVRVAAAEGLGARKATGSEAMATDTLSRLAGADPSTSVRYAAAKAVLEIDAGAAAGLVPVLLADPSEYVRSAGAEILAKSGDEAVETLGRLVASDPHVRVRETALDALKEKKSDAAKAVVTTALAAEDPGIAGIACDVAATNKWNEMAGAIRQVYHRFLERGTPGADAREGAIKALAELGLDEDRPLFASAGSHDPDAPVRAAAWKAFDAGDPSKKDAPPAPFERRAHAVPFGAPLLDGPASLVVTTSKGTFTIRLYPEEAPVHCAHVVDVARKGLYDGLSWHRVVPDFVIQGACPRGDGAGNAGVTLQLEPTRIPFERGTLGMPRSEHPDTGGCQLFICHSRAPHLDVNYTAFGRVVDGIDVIDAIDVDDRILSVRVK